MTISRSAFASIVVSAYGLPNCSCASLREEILKRFGAIELVDEPKWTYSNFVKGYETLPVRIPG